MKELIDTALAYWEDQELNCHPGDIPKEMVTGKTNDGWYYWKAIESRVTNEEIRDLEEYLNLTFPPSYVELLKHKHFIELQIGEVSILPHPSYGWRASITDAVFGGYPRELLIDKGYMPFANFSDWGLWCFGLKEKNGNGEYPIYQWDHDQPDKFLKVADDLKLGLRQQWENRSTYEN